MHRPRRSDAKRNVRHGAERAQFNRGKTAVDGQGCRKNIPGIDWGKRWQNRIGGINGKNK